jgi:3-mercaptopyruvate sulfurtransferase SseA
MRSLTLLTLTAILSVIAFAACNSNETLLTQNNSAPVNKTATPPPPPPPTDNAKRIPADELHKLWEKNEVLIIDTRAESAYQQEHIKGSISMPTGTVLQRIDELPRDKMIVAYCT